MQLAPPRSVPELPDVEGWKRYAARYAEGQRVRRVRVPDKQVLRNISPRGLARALSGQRLGHPERYGKWLVIPAKNGQLAVHFGMTGALKWTGASRDRARFERLILELDGGELAYCSQRKLGGLWWAKNGVSEVAGDLGPDAARIEKAEFCAQLDGVRRTIKATLMDQKLIAGIGNELSDEILWRARVRPGSKVRDLKPQQLNAIYSAVRKVVRRSMKHGRIPTERPWFKSERGKPHPVCPRCGSSVRTGKVAGRTAYFCPRCRH